MYEKNVFAKIPLFNHLQLSQKNEALSQPTFFHFSIQVVVKLVVNPFA